MITLVPPNLDYAGRIFELTDHPLVHEHLAFRNVSVDDVIKFIKMVQYEESEGKTVSRFVLNEGGEVIGATTLMEINKVEGTCKLGSWLGQSYWGKGYNQAAKDAILRIAFEDLGLRLVFVGARRANLRSQKAQEKLPYITLGVEEQFPDIHQKLEEKEKQPCVLNVVYRDRYFDYIKR
ncbi:GNAT family N-acetyltransferase [Ammoniphilus sp. CFH 90114]|uniref:GNAT family N-acetyltransferase n=1 Tax=Ammoniphilus sp. CFH 90114 TaxID=2493665 RepID=UPI00100FA5AE|nr:GNAT family N-acetyltransferase [Ammoniphilus sp. CFH 90114]RXT08729.1 N-acetyltransferase [Ammoniphilus sp. CFH 90114]